jgi:Uma2 family endonuclease
VSTDNANTTAEELLVAASPQSELMEGSLVMKTPAGFDQGRFAAKIAAVLENHVSPHKLGVVTTAGAGFQLAHDPDTVRVPDVAFVRTEDLPPGGVRGFFHGPPDLAVEILASHDRADEVAAKVKEWLQAGCLAIWVVDPQHQTITVHQGLKDMTILGPGDTLVAAELLPEFSMAVADIFA